MKLWRPKQPDSSFRGSPEALWLRTLTIIPSASLFVISSMCTLWQKGRKQGGEKIPEQHLTLQPSSLLQPLPLSFLVASILLATRREQPEPAQRHTAQRTLRRTGGKQKGKERRADVMEEWDGSPPGGGPRSHRLFQCPTVRWERGCGGFGKMTVT